MVEASGFNWTSIVGYSRSSEEKEMASANSKVVLVLDERNPSDVFVKLRWLARTSD